MEELEDEPTETEIWREINKDAKREKEENRVACRKRLPWARGILAPHGVRIRENSETHYTLIHADWTLEIYPGTKRLYRQGPKGAKAPHLELPDEWSMDDLARAVIQALGQTMASCAHGGSSVKEERQLREVRIWTDGSAYPNPGTAGWGAILEDVLTGFRKEYSGGERDSSNNRGELLGAINALKALKVPCKVTLTSDSQYLVNAFNRRWIYSWDETGQLQSQALKNQDLWIQLWELNKFHEITWVWVRGHNGHPENERCDQLAAKARKELA